MLRAIFDTLGVVVALGLEGGGGGFQAGGVGEDVVAGSDAVKGYLCRACGGASNRRDGDVPAEVLVKGLEHHGGAALLALTAVAGDMGCCHDAFLQQVTGNVGLVLPAVEADVAVPTEQGSIVGDGATGGVEQQAATGQAVQKPLVAQVPRGPLAVTRERRVESDDVTALLQRLEGLKNFIKRTVPIFPGRVIEQDVETQLTSPAGDDGADVAHANDAEGKAVGGCYIAVPHPSGNSGKHPLGNGGGVAAWCIAHGDAVGGAVIEVDVVGADGRRADETHAAAIEQRGIATRAGAHDEGIGITHGIAGDVTRLQIQDFGPWLYQSLDVRDMAIDDDSHGIRILAAQNARQPMTSSRRNT